MSFKILTSGDPNQEQLEDHMGRLYVLAIWSNESYFATDTRYLHGRWNFEERESNFEMLEEREKLWKHVDMWTKIVHFINNVIVQIPAEDRKVIPSFLYSLFFRAYKECTAVQCRAV